MLFVVGSPVVWVNEMDFKFTGSKKKPGEDDRK